MPDRIFKIIFILGWAVYMFGIYTPNMRRYRKQQVNVTHSRPLDVALDMVAFLGWQVVPLVFAFSPRLTFGNFDLPAWCGWVGTLLFTFSIWLFGRAYADLGRSWSPKIDITERQKLVTDGVYTHIRHPGLCCHVAVGYRSTPVDGKLDRRVCPGSLLFAPCT